MTATVNLPWPGEPDVSACPICRRDTCEGCERPKERRRFLSDEEVLAEPIPAENIEGISSPRRITSLISDPGTGKSLLIGALAGYLGEGRDFAGLRIKEPGSTAIVSYERDSFRKRYAALRKVGLSTRHLYLLRTSAPLSPVIARDGSELPSLGEEETKGLLRELEARLATEGKPPVRLVGIDTIRRAMVGKEESSEITSAFLRAVLRVLDVVPLAGAMTVHHRGWGAEERGRGSSALRGDVDNELFLKAGKPDLSGVARLTLSSENKSKDDRPFVVNLIRKPVPLGEFDEDGRELWSAVVLPEADAGVEPLEEDHVTETVSAKVLRAIASGSFTTKEQVRDRTRLAMNDVRPAIRVLLDNRLIEKSGNGKPFRLTPSGLESLNPTTRLEPDSTRLSRIDQPDPTTPPLGGVGESASGRNRKVRPGTKGRAS